MAFPISESTQHICCGEPIMPPDRREKIFLGVVTTEILALIGLTCWTIISLSFPLTDETRYTFAYALTLLFNSLCILYFVFDGILRERKEELYAFFLASALVAAYATYDYFIGCEHEQYCLARMVVALVLQPFNIGFGIYIMKDLNWLAYQVSGANKQLQRLYRLHGAFIGLVKVDFQCAVSLVILASLSGVLSETALFLSFIGLWVSVWWIALAWYATRHEHRFLMYLFFALALAEPAYVVYKMIMIASDWSSYETLIAYPSLILGGFSLFTRVVVVWLGILVTRGFNKGLKPHLLREPMAASLLPRT